MAGKYDHEYKVQAVKPAKEIGGAKAAKESGSQRFFRRQPSEVSKNQTMIFLALKTEDGRITGKISFYCRMPGVSRQGFYKYLANKDRPWKYQYLADAMKEIISEG